MNLSILTSIFRKFTFFKDYSSLVVPVLLAILAALLFIPTTLIQHSLAVKIEEQSKSKEQTLRNLGDVPSSGQWLEEQKKENAIQKDVNNIMQMAQQSSKRPLLSLDIFPEPKGTSPQLFQQFGQQYRQVINGWINEMKARQCPTTAEINQSLNKPASTEVFSETTNIPETDKIIINELCKQIAGSIKVYFDQTNIPGYQFWEKYNYTDKDSAVEDCWYWQTAYWIIEDCLQTVKSLNAGSTDVLKSPVKRIVEIAFTSDSATAAPGTLSGQAFYLLGQGRAGRPSYVTSLTSGLASPPLTARISNDRRDVVHFRMTAIVRAQDVPRFMEELCSGKQHTFKGFRNELKEETYSHNQITILKILTSTVNPEDNDNKLYRYGNDALIKVELTCEYVFDKKGYDEVKPASVKKRLESLIQQGAAAF